MPEYTFVAVLVLLAVFILDRFVFRTRLFGKKKFWLFQAIGLVLTFFFDGVLENLPIIWFDYGHTLGLRLINIPLENFLFGFVFLAACVVFYEYFYERFQSFSG